MPKTPGRWNADTPQSFGFLFIDATQLKPIEAGPAVARNALGDYSLNVSAAGTYHIIASSADNE